MREYRGTLTEPGKESPHRNRTIEENLDLFERMKMVNLKMVKNIKSQNRYVFSKYKP